MDLPYLVASCCISYVDSGSTAKALACDLLKKPGVDWTSVGYQKDFAAYMGARRQTDLALDSAMAASKRSSDSTALFESVMAGSPDATVASGKALLSMILGKAALENLPASEQEAARVRLYSQVYAAKYPESGSPGNASKKGFAQSLGIVIAAGMKGDTAGFHEKLVLFRSTAAKDCALMTPSEVRMINRAAEIAERRMPDATMGTICP